MFSQFLDKSGGLFWKNNNSTKQKKAIYFFIVFDRLTVVYVSFCRLTKGITPKICRLCIYVIIHKRSFESCMCLDLILERQQSFFFLFSFFSFLKKRRFYSTEHASTLYSIPFTHTQISMHNKVIYGSLTEKKAICMGEIKNEGI